MAFSYFATGLHLISILWLWGNSVYAVLVIPLQTITPWFAAPSQWTPSPTEILITLQHLTLTFQEHYHLNHPHPLWTLTLQPALPSSTANTHPSACSTLTLYEHSPFILLYPHPLWTLTLHPAVPPALINTHPSACSTLTLYQHSPFILQYPHPQELWTLTLQPAAPSPSINTHPSTCTTLTLYQHSPFSLQPPHPLSTLTLHPAVPSPSRTLTLQPAAPQLQPETLRRRRTLWSPWNAHPPRPVGPLWFEYPLHVYRGRSFRMRLNFLVQFNVPTPGQ